MACWSESFKPAKRGDSILIDIEGKASEFGLRKNATTSTKLLSQTGSCSLFTSSRTSPEELSIWETLHWDLVIWLTDGSCISKRALNVSHSIFWWINFIAISRVSFKNIRLRWMRTVFCRRRLNFELEVKLKSISESQKVNELRVNRKYDSKPLLAQS